MASPAHVLRRLLAQGALLVVMVLLGAATGFLFGRSQPPTYDAQAYVVVTPLAQSSDATAVNFAQAYGRIVTQEVVLAPALARLGQGGSVAELRRQIRVSTSPDAPLIQLTGSAGTPTQAADLANAVSKALIDYGLQRRLQTRVRLDSFADAFPPSAPTSPNVPVDIAVGAAAGLLLGGLAIMAGVGRRSAVSRQPELAAGTGAGAEDQSLYRALARGSERPADRGVEPTANRTVDHAGPRAADHVGDRSLDRAGDRVSPRTAERGADHGGARAGDRFADRAGDRGVDRAGARTADHLGDRAGDRFADRAGDRGVDRAGARTADHPGDRAGDRFADRAGDRTADRAGAAAPVPRPRDGGRPDPRPTVDSDVDGETPAEAAGRRSPWDM